MRGILLSLVVAAIVACATPQRAAAFAGHAVLVPATSASLGLQNPAKDIKVDINVGHSAWYRNPVWVAIGVLAFVVIVLLIVVAVRGGGGGTTIIRD